MKFVMASDEVILVTTPEPTSITDAYALVKMVSNRDKNKVIKVLVNRAEDEKEANEVINRLTMVSEKFLGLKINSAGSVLRDDMVIKAVKLQQPFTISFPRSPAAKSVNDIARKLLDADEKPDNESIGMRRFVSRLINIFH
jgi:flagellar biosynthesis protein FlhG